MIVRFLIASLAIAAISGTAFAVWNGGSDEGDNTGSYGSRPNDYREAAPLVDDSELIVRAAFVSEVDETIRPSSSTTREDVLRTYRVLETIKGDSLATGDEIVVWTTRTFTHHVYSSQSETFEQLPAQRDTVYVLFLTRLARSESVLGWSNTGEPMQAEVRDDNLAFQTTVRYRETLRAHNIEIPPGAGAPFALTLPELRQLVTQLAVKTPTPMPTVFPTQVSTP